MANIYLSRDNAITHQLQFTPVGSNKIRNYNLTGATEIRVEFYQDRKLLKSLSSLNHTGIQIVNASQGIVSYQPELSDLSGVFDVGRVNLMRWVVFNLQNPNGLVFGQPALPVRIYK